MTCSAVLKACSASLGSNRSDGGVASMRAWRNQASGLEFMAPRPEAVGHRGPHGARSPMGARAVAARPRGPSRSHHGQAHDPAAHPPSARPRHGWQIPPANRYRTSHPSRPAAWLCCQKRVDGLLEVGQPVGMALLAQRSKARRSIALLSVGQPSSNASAQLGKGWRWNCTVPWLIVSTPRKGSSAEELSSTCT